MSDKKAVMAGVRALQDIIVSQELGAGRPEGLDRLNRVMSSIKRVGCVEKMPLNGSAGTYLIIDGRSWADTCRDLGLAAAPSFVMWEETEFLSFLRSEVVQNPDGADADERKATKRSRGGKRKETGQDRRKEAS